MPFCRHCGELVLKDRCTKCGGTGVGPSFSWKSTEHTSSTDRWKQTYTAQDTTSSRKDAPQSSNKQPADNLDARRAIFEGTAETTTSSPATRRFPKPGYQTKVLLGSKVSEHIIATTNTRARTPSPVKHTPNPNLDSSPSGNPILDDGVKLSKVYGSVLQSPETLKSYACSRCGSVFGRDSTLYPDPAGSGQCFCRSCFTTNGGVKGSCIACDKPVLKLKAEGQHVENSGRLWHKSCFVCGGCKRNIAANPSVDLLGRPCCGDCFENSLKRKSGPSTPSKAVNNLGGLKGKDREGSPALDELNRRLGVLSSSTTPLANTPSATPSKTKPPTQHHINTTQPTDIEPERVARHYVSPNRSRVESSSQSNTQPYHDELPRSSLPSRASASAAIPASPSPRLGETPDLASDRSDGTGSQDSPLSTPRERTSPTMPLSFNLPGTLPAKCQECQKSLHSIRGGGRIVTVPNDDGSHAQFHSGCLLCAICNNAFDTRKTEENDSLQAVAFIKTPNGIAHGKCALMAAPAKPSHARPRSVLGTIPEKAQSGQIATAPAVFSGAGRQSCPGCSKSVALMEPGVIPGPNASRWHRSCLVCGGRGAKATRRAGAPGCGKLLDRDAKLDATGGVWCSNCMTLLGERAPLSPISASFTGSSGWPSLNTESAYAPIEQQSTGSLVRKLTGNRSNSPVRQLSVSGSLSLRSGSVSPTKMLFGGAVPVNRTLTTRPRPKSFALGGLGMDRQGRGMQLVRQMTGDNTRLESTPREA